MNDRFATGMPAEQPPDMRAVIDELARLLEMLSTQLEAAMRDAGDDSAGLARVLTRITAATDRIESGGGSDPAIAGQCGEIRSCLSDAVMALQFQDRLAQRALKVLAGLEYLRASLRDPKVRPLQEWLELMRDIELIQAMDQARLTPPQSQRRVELFE